MLKRVVYLFCLISCSICASGQNTGQLTLHAGDTLYLSRDLLPTTIDLSNSGEGMFWDMSRLLSAFVQQTMVRPEPRGGLIISGPDDVDRYLTVSPDGLYIDHLGLPIGASGNRLIVSVEPPVPYIRTLEFGNTWDYTGTITIPAVDDKGEARLSIHIHAEVDGSGELNTPTALYEVLRERRDVHVTPLTGANVSVRDLGLPAGFSTGRLYLFQSPSRAFPVAIVQTDASNQAKQVEYLNQPWAGHVVQQVPHNPDIMVYPNPSFGYVRFDLLNLPPGDYDLEIYNILGMPVRTDHIYVNGTKTIPLDLSRLKKGTYIYRLLDSQKNAIRSKRLVIITP